MITEEINLMNFQNERDRFIVLMENYKNKIKVYPLSVAIYYWSQTLQTDTRNKYRKYFNELLNKRIVESDNISIGEWIYCDLQSIIARIKKMNLTPAAEYARIEVLKSLYNFICNLLYLKFNLEKKEDIRLIIKKKKEYRKCDKCDKKPLWFCGIISLCPTHAPRDYDHFTGEYTEVYDKPYHVKDYNDKPYVLGVNLGVPPHEYPQDKCKNCSLKITEENKNEFGYREIVSNNEPIYTAYKYDETNRYPIENIPVYSVRYWLCREGCVEEIR
jgi:hypothetical protein